MRTKNNIKKIIWIVGLAATVFFIGACADDTETLDMRQNWVGLWTCVEVEGDFAPQTYTVEIIEKIDPGHVSIKGLYNQGQQFTVEADVDGFFIDIPTQTVDDFEISGNGNLDDQGDLVTLFFSANDGSGVDAVKAFLRR